jgi:hypothetical protein
MMTGLLITFALAAPLPAALHRPAGLPEASPWPTEAQLRAAWEPEPLPLELVRLQVEGAPTPFAVAISDPWTRPPQLWPLGEAGAEARRLLDCPRGACEVRRFSDVDVVERLSGGVAPETRTAAALLRVLLRFEGDPYAAGSPSSAAAPPITSEPGTPAWIAEVHAARFAVDPWTRLEAVEGALALDQGAVALDLLRVGRFWGACSRDTTPQYAAQLLHRAAAATGHPGWALQGLLEATDYWRTPRLVWASYSVHSSPIDGWTRGFQGIDPALLGQGLVAGSHGHPPVLSPWDATPLLQQEPVRGALYEVLRRRDLDPVNQLFLLVGVGATVDPGGAVELPEGGTLKLPPLLVDALRAAL